MKRTLWLLAVLLALAAPAEAQIVLTYTFTSGTTANPDEVNANFTAVASNALNRAGGTLTGNMTVNAGITIDGIDISGVLGGSGTPTFSSVTTTTLTCTGCVGASQLAATTVSAAAYGGSTAVPTFTVDADGRLTAAGTTSLNTSVLNAGQLALARGGTGADLSATGGSNQVVRQDSAGGVFTVSALEDADIPDTITIAGTNTVTWASVNKTGSSLADLATRSASDLSSGTLPSARLSGTYTNALTFNSGSNSVRGSYVSADGSAGVTATCVGTPTGAWMTVKNGIITAVTC